MRVVVWCAAVTACSGGSAQLAGPSGTITFPDTAVGAVAVMEIGVTNVGGASTGTLAATATGDFGVELGAGNDPASTCVGVALAPGDGCNIDLAFAPLATGARTGSLELSYDDDELTLALAGTGIAATP
jgi:hypothetical protein